MAVGCLVVLLLPGRPEAATPAFGAGAPAYVVSAVPAGSPEADVAGEPSIGVDWRTGAAMYQADATTYRLTLSTTRQPATVTWTPTSSRYSVYNADPILATDPATGLTLAGGDDLACAVMSASRDDGATWTPSVPCALVADHPTVGFAPGAAGHEGLVAYFCQQTQLDACATSLDGGTTWTPGSPINGCQRQFGHLKGGRDGTVYLPSKSCTAPDGTSAVGGAVTTDNGATWTSYTVPGAPTPDRGFDPSVGVTPDGTVYESWARAGDYHPVVAASHDHGRTWTRPVDLAAGVAPALVASTFQAVVAGDNGRIAVAYLGTRLGTPGVVPFDTGYHGQWALYVSTTYDAGATWTTVQVTDAPVQRGTISDGGTTSVQQRNLLDFLDATLTRDGRVLVGYADGCLGPCKAATGTEAESLTDQYATVALQTSGRGLFAAYDTAPAPPVRGRPRRH